MIKFIREGLVALEALLQQDETSGRFCFGDRPTMADCCLVPQLYNADRWGARFDDLDADIGNRGDLPASACLRRSASGCRRCHRLQRE